MKQIPKERFREPRKGDLKGSGERIYKGIEDTGRS